MLAGIGWMVSGFFFYVFPGAGDGPEGSLSWYLMESADVSVFTCCAIRIHKAKNQFAIFGVPAGEEFFSSVFQPGGAPRLRDA